jgi:hypothetical protein
MITQFAGETTPPRKESQGLAVDFYVDGDGARLDRLNALLCVGF